MKTTLISMGAIAALAFAAPAMAQAPTGVGGATGPVTGGAVGGTLPGAGAGNVGPQSLNGGATSNSTLGATVTPNSTGVDAGTTVGAKTSGSMTTGSSSSKTRSGKSRSSSSSSMTPGSMTPGASSSTTSDTSMTTPH